ncbi:uncharacterized protein LOC112506994 [Cynara cardunculus var. scolymus]|uniref:Tubulin alpha-6 chain n=1 Tax=Cynara cardunculus var. scolymus TaxID=59895 RepID=A0A103YKJ0_CYNCS|nr:uncharacterized protein LOC112506994 [Cynara cardunculus var. scolymus]KVI10849.1 hypothetical protein Ccrd_010738 [Cynara cardunculus var. scolymus]
MASVKMLKAGLYPFSASPSSSRRNERFGCSGTRRIVKFSSKLSTNRVLKVSCRIQDADNSERNGEEPPESLFMKELKRRGMTPTSLLDESWTASNNKEMMFKDEDGNISSSNNVSTDFEKSLSNQRERSMALNSEGLEGLIPRANLLLRLGGTFFLAFWPLFLVTVASFSAIYLYFGPKFVHDGTARQVQLPQYIDPYALLEDERMSQTSPMLY